MYLKKDHNEVKIRRWTEQINQIINAIYTADHPLTADEIYTHVRKSIPRISLGTVYRNLRKLADAGLIFYVERDGIHTYFKHPFSNTVMKCIKCGKFFRVTFELDIKEVSKKTGFAVTGWVLTLSGICKECERNAYHGRISAD